MASRVPRPGTRAEHFAAVRERLEEQLRHAEKSAKALEERPSDFSFVFGFVSFCSFLDLFQLFFCCLFLLFFYVHSYDLNKFFLYLFFF